MKIKEMISSLTGMCIEDVEATLSHHCDNLEREVFVVSNEYDENDDMTWSDGMVDIEEIKMSEGKDQFIVLDVSEF